MRNEHGELLCKLSRDTLLAAFFMFIRTNYGSEFRVLHKDRFLIESGHVTGWLTGLATRSLHAKAGHEHTSKLPLRSRRQSATHHTTNTTPIRERRAGQSDSRWRAYSTTRSPWTQPSSG